MVDRSSDEEHGVIDDSDYDPREEFEGVVLKSTCRDVKRKQRRKRSSLLRARHLHSKETAEHEPDKQNHCAGDAEPVASWVGLIPQVLQDSSRLNVTQVLHNLKCIVAHVEKQEEQINHGPFRGLVAKSSEEAKMVSALEETDEIANLFYRLQREQQEVTPESSFDALVESLGGGIGKCGVLTLCEADGPSPELLVNSSNEWIDVEFEVALDRRGGQRLPRRRCSWVRYRGIPREQSRSGIHRWEWIPGPK